VLRHPHRSANATLPFRVRRHDRAGGVIHEYRLVASIFGTYRIRYKLAVALLKMEKRTGIQPLVGAGHRTKGESKVVPYAQALGVVGAQHPLEVGKRPLEQRDRLLGPPRLPIGES
jgi:hypothetical protein